MKEAPQYRHLRITLLYIGIFGMGIIVGTGVSHSFAFKKATATLFWVGEAANGENAFISNAGSYWDSSWMEHFGGSDDPGCRDGYHPCGFVPKENPFYVALPYGEFERGTLKAEARLIPWFHMASEEPLLKNRWVEVRHKGKNCYAQWEDVGPNNEDDFGYVFGLHRNPQNSFGEKAGIDVSPAVATCLGIEGSGSVFWRFRAEEDVPEGPWWEIVTSRGISWE